jgi:hypothetical protein
MRVGRHLSPFPAVQIKTKKNEAHLLVTMRLFQSFVGHEDRMCVSSGMVVTIPTEHSVSEDYAIIALARLSPADCQEPFEKSVVTSILKHTGPFVVMAKVSALFPVWLFARTKLPSLFVTAGLRRRFRGAEHSVSVGDILRKFVQVPKNMYGADDLHQGHERRRL